MGIGVIEAFPGVFHWLVFIFVNTIGVLAYGHGISMSDVARSSPTFSIFKFHSLPSGYAAPLFFGIGYVVFIIDGWIGRVNARQQILANTRKCQERLLIIEEELRQKEIAESREREQNEQRELATRLDSLAFESVAMARNLPNLIREAERALDLACNEFEEGVLDPFWDAIEQATAKLATFDSHVQQIIHNADLYRTESGRLPQSPAIFQLGVDVLPDATHTATRMRAIVRRAHKNADFSKIFHLRKTNELLIAGFSTLGDALNVLGDRLRTSLGRLSSDFSVSISKLADAQRDSSLAIVSEISLAREQAELQSETVASELRLMREQAESDSEESRNHEEQEREMLNNIQRRRRPRPHRFQDGEY